MNHIPLQEGPPPLQFLGNLASVQTSRRSGRAKYLLRSTSAPPSSWCKTDMEISLLYFGNLLPELFSDLYLLDEASSDKTNSCTTLPHLEI